jgi:hypothetical protein
MMMMQLYTSGMARDDFTLLVGGSSGQALVWPRKLHLFVEVGPNPSAQPNRWMVKYKEEVPRERTGRARQEAGRCNRPIADNTARNR